MKQRPHPSEPLISRRRLARLLGAGSVAALLLAPSLALAQQDADIKPPPPNILLLVDTSGSMDYKTASTSFPTCSYAGVNPTGQADEKSRWIELVEVLTGSINQYKCQKLDRNGTIFKDEYDTPYDYLYPNPYHRPVSGTCVASPGTLGADPALFPPGAIKYHPINDKNATCNFQQATDGVLDSFVDDVRFGLMTFDTEAHRGTDVTGLWSYYLSSPKRGRPKDCTADEDQEVGVRNPSAPPWEGRAIGFGDPAGGSDDYKERNARIQEVLVATRPYGATPIAGMLDDARAYFLNDDSTDPLNSSFDFGPKDDPATCRKKSIILLSDGQPNMDLRPYCEPANCPYDKAEAIAQFLKSKDIEIFVIGFALSKVMVNSVEKTCSSFTAEDFDEGNPTGICRQNPNDPPIQACCALNRIAAAGGHAPAYKGDEDWRRAHFADNRDELRAALGRAIGANFAATTRQPVVSASGAGFVGPTADLEFARSFRFGASFEPARLDQPWRGEITRTRYICDDPSNSGKKTPRLLEADIGKGDFFAANVIASGPAARKLFAVVGDAPINQKTTLRPNIGAISDGAGDYSGTLTQYTSATFASSIPPEAIGVDDNRCADKTAAQCRDHYLKWLVGLDNGTVNRRCKDGECSLIGDIVNATPRPVAGRPNELINDASYEKFAKQQIEAKRPSVLYVPSNDGFLHAFKIAAVTKDPTEQMKVKSLESNELWAFVPPATLAGLTSLYPGSHQLLLDGTPVVKDVVATESASTPYPYKLERSKTQAQTGEGTWRTILVQSFGADEPGYFALDVTEPVVGPSSGGPKFLWQLTKDETGRELFGSGGATPLITTVFIDKSEVAVAVLPGGKGDASSAGPCPRATAATGYSGFVSGFEPRRFVPCYTAESSISARSITVVRLDNGEILRTFRQSKDELPALDGVTTVAPIDSPLTGQPVAFPAEVGAVADRVFIGDQDGALWRLNFASENGSPQEWTFELFFDGFPGDGTFGHAWDHGQPIATPPIISVDSVGNLTIAFSTGDQKTVGTAANLANYVWSLLEKPNADRTKLLPEVKWHLDFKASPYLGDRVIGAMALFSGDLYFTTMGPQPNSNDGACTVGVGKLWGMRYLEKNTGGEGLGGVMAASLKTLAGSNPYVPALKLLGTSTSTAFFSGASVGQQPTCENVPSTPTDDEYFSYGAHQSLGQPQGGKFQLFVSTGAVASTSTEQGIEAIDQGGANAVAIDLQSPRVTTRVDSWAAIVE
jgi:type IV pilus assembly protein PilY1